MEKNIHHSHFSLLPVHTLRTQTNDDHCKLKITSALKPLGLLLRSRINHANAQFLRVVQYSDKFMHSIVLYYIHITIDYSADTRTMNAMALFSLYLYFFFTYFNIFSQLANHSLESMQRPRLFPAFFPRYFQSGAMISNNGGDIFPISFSNFLSITVVSLLYKSVILYQ